MKSTIIKHHQENLGQSLNYKTLGNVEQAKAAYDELLESGELVWAKIPSATGRKMNKIVTSEFQCSLSLNDLPL